MIKSLGKKIPYFILLDLAMIAREHWGFLEPRDRSELARIIKKSGGRPANLTSHDRSELARIVRELDLITAGRRLLPLNGGVRKSKLRARRR